MAPASAPDLIKVTEIFLVPSSFLVAALGTADTNPHRAAVSLLGLIISGLWCVCSREAIAEDHPAEDHPADTESGKPAPPRRTRILAWLAVVFTSGWLLSLVVHLALWQQQVGAK